MMKVEILYKGTVKRYVLSDRKAAERVPAAAAFYKAMLGDAVRIVVKRGDRPHTRPPHLRAGRKGFRGAFAPPRGRYT